METVLGLSHDIGEIESGIFEELVERIKEEPTMLHPAAREIEQSFLDQLAVLNYNSETGLIYSYARLEPSLTEQTKSDLGLPISLPNIYELGTVYSRFQGNGAAGHAQNKLLSYYLEQINQEKMLVILTAKPPAMKKTTRKAKLIGINFVAEHHFEDEFIAPFTCVCREPFGSGLQYGEYCPARVSSNLIPVEHNFETVMNQDEKGNSPCVMFISNQNLAHRTNNQLREIFGTQTNLVNVLKKYGYYGPEFKK